MPRSKKPNSPPASPPTSPPSNRRAETLPNLDPVTRQVVLDLLSQAESAVRQRYFDSWLQTLNNPEQTRMRAQVIGDCFAEIRGALNRITSIRGLD